MVAQLIRNQQVVGSSPISSSMSTMQRHCTFFNMQKKTNTAFPMKVLCVFNKLQRAIGKGDCRCLQHCLPKIFKKTR